MLQPVFILESFTKYFQLLGYTISSSQNLFTGITIAQFISGIANIKISQSEIKKDFNIGGSILSNFKLIIQQIEKYNHSVLNNEQYFCNININQIYVQKSSIEVIKLLKEILLLATKAENCNYYIEKILQLEEKYQVVFAELIKEENNIGICVNHESELNQVNQNTTTNSNQNLNNSRQVLRQRTFQLIDKLYEIEQENERLASQLKKQSQQRKIQKQKVLHLCSQIQSQKIVIEHLQSEIADKNDKIERLVKKGKQNETQENRNKNKNNNNNFNYINYQQQLERLQAYYKKDKDNMLLEMEKITRKYEDRLQEKNYELKCEIQCKEKFFKEAEVLKEEKYELFLLINAKESELNNVIKDNQKLYQDILAFRQNQNMLRFEANHQKIKISEMQQIIEEFYRLKCQQEDNMYKSKIENENNQRMGQSNEYDQLTESKRKRRRNLGSMSSSKLLTTEISSHNTYSSPNLHRDLMKKVENSDEVKVLKNQIKELKKQIQKYKQQKKKLKQVEYQRNKLIKILNEYEMSRGEENDIITGCLYELQQKLRNKGPHSPISKNQE